MDTQSTSCSPLSPSQSVSLPPLASFDFPPPAFSSNNERRPSSIFTGASSPSSSPLASPFSLPSWSPFHSATDAVDDSSPVISASLWSKPLHRLPPRTSDDNLAAYSLSGCSDNGANVLGIGSSLPSVGSLILSGSRGRSPTAFERNHPSSSMRTSFSSEHGQRSPSASPPGTPSQLSSFGIITSRQEGSFSSPPSPTTPHYPTVPPSYPLPPTQPRHQYNLSFPTNPYPYQNSSFLDVRGPSLGHRVVLDPPKLASIHTILHGSAPASRSSIPAAPPRSPHPYERRDSSTSSSNTSPPSPTRPNTTSASNGSSNAGRAPISRTTRACDNCRARKTRCLESEGGEGSCCGRCRDMGLDCAWSGGGKKRGPVAGSTRPSSSHSNARRASITPTASNVLPNFDQPFSLRPAWSYPVQAHPPPSILASSLACSKPIPSQFFPRETPSVFAPSSSATPHGEWSQNEPPVPSRSYSTPSSFLGYSSSSNGQHQLKQDRGRDLEEEGRLPSLNVVFGGGERDRPGVRLY